MCARHRARVSRFPLRELQLKASTLAAKEVAPHAEVTDREGRWPEQPLRSLLAEGLGGLVVPESDGGLGFSLVGLLAACEAIGTACASTAMCFGMHATASAVIAAKATPSQRASLLAPIARGEHLSTLSLSEPGTGAHFYIPQVVLRREGEAYVLKGTKSFVTNGGHADSYVMSAVHAEADSPPGQFSALVVPGRAPGLAWGDRWEGVGMRGNSSRNVDLRDVRVPTDNLLGAEGDQTWYVFHVIAPHFLTAMAGTYLGVGRASVQAVTEHLRSRRYAHSGARLASAPVVQHHLGALWADLERARQLCYFAASQGETGGPDAMPAILSAKVEATDAAVRVANEAMTLAGGIGYARSGVLDRHLRDARAGPVMAPTSDMLRVWTGRWLLGEPLLGD